MVHKMLLELKKEQIDRLNRFDDLKAHIGDRDTKRMYVARPDKVKISAEQVREVKHRLAAGQAIINITRDTGVSEYHIRGVRRNRYDFLLE